LLSTFAVVDIFLSNRSVKKLEDKAGKTFRLSKCQGLGQMAKRKAGKLIKSQPMGSIKKGKYLLGNYKPFEKQRVGFLTNVIYIFI